MPFVKSYALESVIKCKRQYDMIRYELFAVCLSFISSVSLSVRRPAE